MNPNSIGRRHFKPEGVEDINDYSSIWKRRKGSLKHTHHP